MLVTGYSGQTIDWIAEHADGWLYYPRDFNTLMRVMQNWKAALAQANQQWKPFMQSLYVDVTKDVASKPTPIHLGIRSGTDYLNVHLKRLQSHGVNHVMLNLKYGSRPAAEMIETLGAQVIPNFL